MGDLTKALVNKALQVTPKIIFAIVIVILGWIVSKIIARIVRKILESIKVDSLADKLNEIDVVQKSNITIKPSAVISKVVYYLGFFMALLIATDTLEIESITNLMTDFMNYLPSLFSAVIFFLVGLLIADSVKGLLFTTCKSLGIPSANAIASIVFYFLLMIVTMSALDQARISTDLINDSFLIIISGVVISFALGYGLASKEMMANFLASKEMMANFLASFYVKNKFEAGDRITVEGVEGQIETMDNKSFVLKTDNKKVVFPLSKLAHDKVEIHS